MSRFSIVEITLICVSYFCTTSPRTCISCRVVSVLYGICMHLSMLAVDGIMPCHIPIILESFLIHCHPSVEHVAAATYSSPTLAIPSVSSARFEALLVASSKGAEAQQLMVDGALQHVWLGRLELQWIY